MTSQIDITKPVFGTPTTQSVRDNFTTAANEISVLQSQTAGSPFLSLQGGRMGGPMYLFNDPTDAMQPATKGYVDAGGAGGGGGIPEAPSVEGDTFGRSQGAWVEVLALAGGTMLGPIIAAADPTDPLGLATKQYVDALKPTIIPDAPNDAFFYGRHANAWAQVLALTGGVLSGSLGVGVALPSDVSTTIRSVMTGQETVAANGGFGFNSYIDTAGTWRYLAAGGAAAVTVAPSTGVMSLAAAASGAADAAISWGAPLTIDAKGNLTLSNGPTIPTDVSHPTLSAFYHTVGLGGYLTYNAYQSASGWKYIAAGYAGTFYQDTNGTFTFLATAGSGAAGGAISYNGVFTIDRSGNCWCAGNSTVGNLTASNGSFSGTITASAIVGNNSVQVTNGVNMGVNINMPTTGSIFWASSWQMVVNASAQLQFGHAITFNPDGNINGGAITVTGNANITGVSYASAHVDTSDKRLKERFAPLDVDCLGVLERFALQQFDWKAPAERPHISCGFTAQDVRSLIPEAVSVGPDGALGVDLMPLVAHLIGAVQQLSGEIAALKQSRA